MFCAKGERVAAHALLSPQTVSSRTLSWAINNKFTLMLNTLYISNILLKYEGGYMCVWAQQTRVTHSNVSETVKVICRVYRTDEARHISLIVETDEPLFLKRKKKMMAVSISYSGFLAQCLLKMMRNKRSYIWDYIERFGFTKRRNRIQHFEVRIRNSGNGNISCEFI